MKKMFLLLFLYPALAFAQDDELLEELNKSSNDTVVTIATFKGTRVINGHSIETKNRGTLEFIFSHRFGAINTGWYEMYGLDEAYVRLGLDYGISEKLSVSFGRNSVDKTLDGYFKYRLLQQKSGATTFPLAITVLGGTAYKLSPKKNSDVSSEFKAIDRVSYTGQLLIGRKITSAFSLQLMPTVVHKNGVDQSIEKNTQFALGVAGRVKATRSFAFTAEYYHNLSKLDNSPYHNVLGIGVDIETGGHVFQMMLTNAIGLTERAFITETQDDFFDGDIHFGFNVTRTFQLKKSKP